MDPNHIPAGSVLVIRNFGNYSYPVLQKVDANNGKAIGKDKKPRG